MDLDVNPDRPKASLLAEVKRENGDLEYFRVDEEGNHISITKEEYDDLGGAPTQAPGRIITDWGTPNDSV